MTKYVLNQLSSKKLLQRTIWRTWGSDAEIVTSISIPKMFDRLHRPRFYFNVIKLYIKNKQRISFKKNLLGFAGANIIDKINISSIYSTKEFFYINYDGIGLVEQKPNKVPWINNKIKIMVGHSGFASENHIRILDKLISFDGIFQSVIIVPVVYGEKQYINDLVERYKGTKNIIFIMNNYPENEYNWILKNIDVAILGSNSSTGLGTICKLLRYQKTIWLSEKGIIAKGFKNDNIPFYNIEEMNNDIFNKERKLTYNADESSISYPSKSQIIERWKEIDDFTKNYT